MIFKSEAKNISGYCLKMGKSLFFNNGLYLKILIFSIQVDYIKSKEKRDKEKTTRQSFLKKEILDLLSLVSMY